MWILDSYYKGCVELWSRERGLSKTSVAYPPSFYMHLKDPHAHWDMIEGLESRYKVEECSFNTIFGSYQGHRIFANRKVAEKIEKQTRPQIAQLTRIRVLSALGLTMVIPRAANTFRLSNRLHNKGRRLL